MKAIPLLIPDMPDADAISPYLMRLDSARRYTNFGPLVLGLEHSLAQALGEPTPHVVTVANCTLGLEIALAALGLDPGTKVLLPALTFIASASAVFRAGLVPVLADANEHTWLLTPEIARDALKQHKLGCIIPVATFGCPQPPVGWDQFVRETGIPVLIDAAGGFGNQVIGEAATVVFSFHATKSLGMGEGGAVVSRDPADVDRVRRLSNFGIDLSLGVSTATGTNAKMSEYHAAVGHAALKRWPERHSLRQSLHGFYCDQLSRLCPAVALQERPRSGAYSIMQVALPAETNRDSVMLALAEMNIETRRWYLPLLPDHPACARVATCDLSTVRRLGPRMLGLPFHLELTEKCVIWLCSALAKVLATTE